MSRPLSHTCAGAMSVIVSLRWIETRTGCGRVIDSVAKRASADRSVATRVSTSSARSSRSVGERLGSLSANVVLLMQARSVSLCGRRTSRSRALLPIDEEFDLFRRRLSAEDLVAMRKAAEAPDDAFVLRRLLHVHRTHLRVERRCARR